ncbi:MAG TPA: acyl carrier protein [Candidatus Eubacterium pullicola]|uniref:Acyl carrier protein n=1 Tax=Gallibacter intestinalis TaxID=2779356 RepID=A0ABR9QV72_9FIRM|nr:phosphopantetheine-binding protein [Gallibacter intestinalis]MBE5034760.1 acyl carrier protein [Gallibacter intestinalis]HIW39915.1 acyl carrier protein [Candidatus Eubacterium pullicola]
MERLIEILENVKPDVDFENCETLIDDGLLDSFSILAIVGEINDEFDVEISAPDIVPENFNSAKALWALVERLQ